MSIWPLSRRRHHKPIPASHLAVVAQHHGLARRRYEDDLTAAADGAGYRLRRAEIEDVDAAVWWLLDQAGDGGPIWKHKTPEELRNLACWLLWERYRFRREFDERRGEP